VWGRGFRPFFLLVGLYGCGGVLAWIAMLLGFAPAPGWLGPTAWHGHEMLFGVVAAAVAGFLLTSVPVWTGTKAVAGGRLAALAGLWVAGRLALLGAGALPSWAVAAVDLLFVPALAGTIAGPLLAAGAVRNLGFVPILLVLFGSNLRMHAQAVGLTASGASGALRVGVDLVVVLIVIVGGRITPSFTANAFERSGIVAPISVRPWLDRAAIAGVVLVAAFDVAAPRTALGGCAALLAGALVAGRMLGWQSLRTVHDPLLWSLHVGYAWIPVGLLLVGIGDLTQAVPQVAGLHALTAGAMGAMILAVMTRVSLGHTGRPLVLPRGAAAAYGLVNVGALVRTAGPILAPGLHLPVLAVAGVSWGGAFGLFVVLYWRILTRPRVDDRPG
jgi:uncharacterized protein involved in response to NO